MNMHSSRSHAIFIITIECSTLDDSGRGTIRVGKLNLVDLAGSERQSKTGTVVRIKDLNLLYFFCVGKERGSEFFYIFVGEERGLELFFCLGEERVLERLYFYVFIYIVCMIICVVMMMLVVCWCSLLLSLLLLLLLLLLLFKKCLLFFLCVYVYYWGRTELPPIIYFLLQPNLTSFFSLLFYL